MEYIKLKKSNCKNCYKCIRNCPVKSIRFADNQAHIVEDECILCGRCFVVCPQNAKEIRNDVQKAKSLIASGVPVIASLAPSFIANYGVSIQAMEHALKRLGFSGAEETAIGATLVKKQYEQLVAEGESPVIVSTCCPTVNTLVQKYYPEALPYLAKVVTPMRAHSDDIKRRIKGAKTVFIGPCLSKKYEAESDVGSDDCVLTFEELTEWLREQSIPLEDIPAPEQSGQSRARLFPTSGGILNTMDCDSEQYSYLSVDGIDNCIAAIKDIIEGKIDNCFIEMSACAGSCVGGPAMDRDKRAIVRDTVKVKRYAGKQDFPIEMPCDGSLTREIGYLGLKRTMPGSRAIEEILHQMGKQSPEDELNCGSCGYDTCRDKALAVLWGKADLSMCLPYLKEKAESFSDTIIKNTPTGIIVLNEALEVQQINAAALCMFHIKNATDILGDQVVRILDPQVFLDVLYQGANVRDKRVYLAEYDRFAEQTVIYDKSYQILMCLMRDVTAEEKSKLEKEKVSRKTIEITDQVIEKQMRAVQEIASLLGETTAETKIALTKLKESLDGE